MPRSAARPCNKPGCNTLTRSGYCDKHTHNESRGTSTQRGYDHRWDKLSKQHRQANPLCEGHKARGQLVPVDLVDHIVPVHVAPDRRLDQSNLQSLCRECHAAKTEQDVLKHGAATSTRTHAHRANFE